MSDTENQMTSTAMDYAQAVAFLSQKFPACFSVKGPAKPLKIGIFHDLAERLADDSTLSKTRLRQVLRRYTGAFRYLESCAEGQQRVDLDGQPCGAIDAEHAGHAKTRLEQGRAKVAERNKQRNEARKEESNKRKEARTSKAHKPSRAQPKKARNSGDAPAPKAAAPKVNKLAPEAISNLKIGQTIQVKAGIGVQSGNIKEISKDNVQVELGNGLVVTVPMDMLVS